MRTSDFSTSSQTPVVSERADRPTAAPVSTLPDGWAARRPSLEMDAPQFWVTTGMLTLKVRVSYTKIRRWPRGSSTSKL